MAGGASQGPEGPCEMMEQETWSTGAVDGGRRVEVCR